MTDTFIERGPDLSSPTMIYVFWQLSAARYQVDANLNQLESSDKPVAPLHAGSQGEETGGITDHRVREETNPASSSDRFRNRISNLLFCYYVIQ